MMLTKSVAMSGRTVARPAMSGRTCTAAVAHLQPALGRAAGAGLRSRCVVVRAANEDEETPFTPEIPSISERGKVPDPVTDAKAALDAAKRQRANESSDVMDVMAFNGIGPELINGRLAMLGFVAAIGAELATGTQVVQQYAQAPYLVAATFATIIGASLVPLLLGSKNRVSVGPWTPTAEVWNGRTAMVGFAALLITEAYFGRPLL